MIKRKGNLFDTDAKAIGHGVNCQGVMGAGIAKEFRTLFPRNYRLYKHACGRNALSPGDSVMFYDGEPEVLIVNLATQEQPGADARYEWVLTSTHKTAKRLMNASVDRLAIPMIGCGIGGLEWEPVEQILRSVEIAVPGFEFEVWKYEA